MRADVYGYSCVRFGVGLLAGRIPQGGGQAEKEVQGRRRFRCADALPSASSIVSAEGDAEANANVSGQAKMKTNRNNFGSNKTKEGS